MLTSVDLCCCCCIWPPFASGVASTSTAVDQRRRQRAHLLCCLLSLFLFLFLLLHVCSCTLALVRSALVGVCVMVRASVTVACLGVLGLRRSTARRSPWCFECFVHSHSPTSVSWLLLLPAPMALRWPHPALLALAPRTSRRPVTLAPRASRLPSLVLRAWWPPLALRALRPFPAWGACSCRPWLCGRCGGRPRL